MGNVDGHADTAQSDGIGVVLVLGIELEHLATQRALGVPFV